MLPGTLVLFMAIGLPVVFAFFATNLVGANVFMSGENGILQLVRNAVDSVQSFAPIVLLLMLMCLEVSLATPSFGLLLYVAKGASPESSMRDIVLSVAPFIALAPAVVVLLVAVPELTLWLPRLTTP